MGTRPSTVRVVTWPSERLKPSRSGGSGDRELLFEFLVLALERHDPIIRVLSYDAMSHNHFERRPIPFDMRDGLLCGLDCFPRRLDFCREGNEATSLVRA